MAKTVQEIRSEHSSKAGEIMNGYMDVIDEIRAIREPESGGYLDRLTDEQRMSLMREQKTEKASEAHEQALTDLCRDF